VQENKYAPLTEKEESFNFEEELLHSDLEELDEGDERKSGIFSFSTMFFTIMTIILILIALIRVSDTLIKWFHL